MLYVRGCVCVCECVCVRARVCVFLCVIVCMCVLVRERILRVKVYVFASFVFGCESFLVYLYVLFTCIYACMYA